jgi:hypothetical protein
MTPPLQVLKPTSADDDLPEVNLQSFIVRIWVEEKREGEEAPPWRGSITHVLTGGKRYIKSLDEITRYFKNYLHGIGVSFDPK